MFARLPRWLLLLTAVLSTRAALGADPLPKGAIAQLGTPGGKYAAHPYHPILVSPDGELSGGQVLSPDGKLQAWFTDEHFVRLTLPNDRGEVRRLTGHTAYLAAVAFSPDGKTVASGGNDRTLRLWETESGKELHCCRGHGDQVCAVAFAPDGKTVASGSWDGSVRLWDVATGRELRRLDRHRYEVLTVAFAPDGKSLASGGTDGTVRVWDPATGKELRRWTAHESGVLGLAFARDGKGVIVVTGTRDVRLWDVASGKEVRTLARRVKPTTTDSVTCGAVSPDGKAVALGHHDGTVRLHDAGTGKELRIVGRHPGTVWGVAFSPDGKTVASCARRHGVVRLWDVATGEMVRSYPGHAGGVSRILFTPDGKRLIAAGGSFDPSIIIYDTTTAKVLHRLEGHAWLVAGIAVSPDGKALASVADDKDKTVRLWDLTAGKQRRSWAGEDGAGSFAEVAFSADGSRLMADVAGSPCFYDVTTGKARGTVAGVTRWVGTSADGRTLAAVTSDNFIALVEVATGQERRRFNGGGRRCDWVTFSPDGRRLLTDAGDGTALLWDLTGAAKEGLTPREREQCWRDLAGDGPASYAAIWKLVLSPKEGVPLLREKVKPVKAADVTNVPRWVAELDDDEFTVREKASKGLERAGEAARPALEKALAASPSAEVKRRAEWLLAKLDEGEPGADELRKLRGLEALEAIGTPEAREVIEGLAKGEAGARLTREAKTALLRMGR
jgi:WD40 repeat protein